MTTQELETRLAAMEKDCEDGDCDCRFPEWVENTQGRVFAQWCKGTGRVPLIAGSRRGCWQKFLNRSRVISVSAEVAMESNEHGDSCTLCSGRSWMPDLSMPKVMAWMQSLPLTSIHFSTAISHSIDGIRCMWKDQNEFGETHYEALLLACYEGAKQIATSYEEAEGEPGAVNHYERFKRGLSREMYQQLYRDIPVERPCEE